MFRNIELELQSRYVVSNVTNMTDGPTDWLCGVESLLRSQ